MYFCRMTKNNLFFGVRNRVYMYTAYKCDDAHSLSCTKTVQKKCSAHFKIKIGPFKAKHDDNGYDDDADFNDDGSGVGGGDGGGGGGGDDDNANDDNDSNNETNSHSRFEPNHISQIITQFYATSPFVLNLK